MNIKMEEYKHPPLPEGMEDPDKDKDPIYIKYRNILLQKMRRTNWEEGDEKEEKTVKKEKKEKVIKNIEVKEKKENKFFKFKE